MKPFTRAELLGVVAALLMEAAPADPPIVTRAAGGTGHARQVVLRRRVHLDHQVANILTIYNVNNDQGENFCVNC